MDRIMEKLTILSAAARYDVACTSSGVQRGGDGTHTGNAYASGICHAFTGDGRCISLLKILYTNDCIYDCKYCRNRCSNDVKRVSFTPEEICKLTMEFYRRNYIEGLFLSSGILHSPDYTMGLLYHYDIRRITRSAFPSSERFLYRKRICLKAGRPVTVLSALTVIMYVPL